jgi:hypothetical protein
VQIAAVENYEQKNTATSGKLIKAVYVAYGYVYIFVQVSQVGWSVIPYLLDWGLGCEGRWAKNQTVLRRAAAQKI